MNKTQFKLPYVFIVSSGRAGTTLLASILNASGQIYIPYESDFIARAYPYYWNKCHFTQDNYKHLFRIFKETSQQYGWDMSEDYVLSCLLEQKPKTFAEVNSVIYGAFHEQENTSHLLWGIKRPVLIAHLDRIYRVCPQAKVVHVVRDGRDVCLSYDKIHKESKIKFGPKGVFRNALYWVDGLRRVESYLKENGGSQLHELKYEDLLGDTALSIKQICEFLGIDYKSEMHENFNLFQRNKKVAPEKLTQNIHQKINYGLDPKNTSKYRSAMSRLDKLKFELVAIPYLLKYGYKSDFPALNIILFMPIRSLAFFLARQFNNWRYSRRDKKVYERAHKNIA